jgi:hypothetical protein
MYNFDSSCTSQWSGTESTLPKKKFSSTVIVYLFTGFIIIEVKVDLITQSILFKYIYLIFLDRIIEITRSFNLILIALPWNLS